MGVYGGIVQDGADAAVGNLVHNVAAWAAGTATMPIWMLFWRTVSGSSCMGWTMRPPMLWPTWRSSASKAATTLKPLGRSRGS